MTRNGKVARLPKHVREELNGRLENGEPGSRLVDWLNALPKVRAVLSAEFGGQPINEQNLTAWRQGGYQDWVRHRDALAWSRQVVEESQELAAETGDTSLADHLSAPLAVVLGRLLREAAEAGADPSERRRALLAVSHELALLRRCNHEAGRLRLEQQRWAAAEAHTAGRNEAAKRLLPVSGMFLATLLGELYERKAKETGQVPPEALAFLASMPPEMLRAAGATPETLQMLGIKLNQGESR